MQELLKKLITFKTLSADHKENGMALAWIKKKVGDLPVFVQEFNSHGFPSLVITTRRTKTPTIWLQAHLDVVGGSSQVFRPRVVGRRLYGRGAFDMKFAIACYLKLLRELGRGLGGYDLGVMITTDEEVGGEDGVNFLLNQGFVSLACFLPDGGQNWEVQKAAKGVMHFMVESYGRATHGSRVWQGVNAIEKLMGFLKFLGEIFPGEPCRVKDHFHPTLNIGRVEGGRVANQVPDLARALIDIRFLPGKDKKNILERINLAKERFKGVKVKRVAFGESFELDQNNRFLKTFLSIVEKEVGLSPKFVTSHGSSDARFFAQRGIPVIATRPRGGGHHSEDEWIDLYDLERFYAVLKGFVGEIAKVGR